MIEVEDNKLDVLLNVIKSLKTDIVKSYQVKNDEYLSKDFMQISNSSLEKIWDNKEDSVYDKFI
jgi:hypothetical protein